MTQIAALQMTSSDSVRENLACVEGYLKQAQAQGIKLLLLPENFYQMPKNAAGQHIECDQDGIVQTFLADKARYYGIWIVAGSVAIRSLHDQEAKPTSSCLVYDHRGQRVARYDKIHLFDVDVPGGQHYMESMTYQAGSIHDNVQVINTPFAKIGLSICYDLRFPELYRALVKQGAQLLCVPAAFTAQTGRSHWQSLLQARAIENLCYVLAAGQVGMHANGRETWGHSMLINPWGSIVAKRESTAGLIAHQIDLAKLEQIRQTFPALAHQTLTI